MMKKQNFFQWLFLTRKGNAVLVLAVALGILIATTFFHLLNINLVGLFPPCFFQEATGLHCAGCGGTRCIQALLHLDIAKALYFNPLVVIGVITLFVLFIRLIFGLCRKNYIPPTYNFGILTAIILCVLIVGFLLIRNMPFYQSVFY